MSFNTELTALRRSTRDDPPPPADRSALIAIAGYYYAVCLAHSPLVCSCQ